jgi:hypothetical protein
MRAVETEVDQDQNRWHLLNLIVFPVLTDCAAKPAQIQATFEITRAAAAVLAWKDRHGTFPPTLETALSPVPTDPFDGKPLRYRREGAGFVVYSIGKEGKFTGGAPDQKPGGWDILFRYPLPSYYKGPIKED